LAASNLAKTQEVSDKAERMSAHADEFLEAIRKMKEQQKKSWF
jgi:hypothetical protein